MVAKIFFYTSSQLDCMFVWVWVVEATVDQTDTDRVNTINLEVLRWGMDGIAGILN